MKNIEIYAEVGQRIRHYRKQFNLSQDELSSLISLSRSSLVNIEQGRHRIQLHILLDISERLGVPLVYEALLCRSQGPRQEILKGITQFLYDMNTEDLKRVLLFIRENM